MSCDNCLYLGRTGPSGNRYTFCTSEVGREYFPNDEGKCPAKVEVDYVTTCYGAETITNIEIKGK